MLPENLIPKVILPDNSFQTVVNVIGKTHSRQYLILPENRFQTVLNVIREFIPGDA